MASKKDTGIVNIHGKEYWTVAKRVDVFRKDFPGWAITTEILSVDDSTVIVKATVLNDDGRVISTGIAEENRKSSQINKTSAVENCETSAVGRALAFFGLAGTEIASADEVQNAIHQQSNSVSASVEAETPGELNVGQAERILSDLDSALAYDGSTHTIQCLVDLEAIRGIYEEIISDEKLMGYVWSEIGKWNNGKSKGAGSATKTWLKETAKRQGW